MNQNINLHFSTALLVLKVYLLQNADDIKLGDNGNNEDGYWIEYLSSQMQISSNEFKSIDKKINKIAANIGGYEIVTLSKTDALAQTNNQEYLNNLISASSQTEFRFVHFPKQNLMVWHETPILEKINTLKAFKLLAIGGAYWQGDANNVQMTRLTCCGFSSETELNEYVEKLNERKERDHRKIGKNLEIFTFNLLAGQGMPIWLPKGATLKKIIGDYVHDRQEHYGFNFVSTPVLGDLQLYKISGHYNHYNEDMFPPIKIENEQMMLRPMTCPHHCLVYLSKPHSYRDLPIRISEDSIMHRYESSGSLTGLERVRVMTLLDNHIFCRPDQIENEITNAFNIIKEVIETFNLKFERVDLALHDPNNKEKFIDDQVMWQQSESQLEEALKKLKIPYTKQVGDAAFYGPKIDFQCKTVLNKIITCSTIQLDFSLPQKFNTTYIDVDQTEKKCVIVHLGIIGTYERFIATLLEQTNGVLPLWLAPVQVAIIPVNNTIHENACKTLFTKLKQAKIRCELDLREERLSKKIRDAQIKKIPLQIVIGDKEAENLDVINYRRYGSENAETIALSDFFKMLHDANEKHL